MDNLMLIDAGNSLCKIKIINNTFESELLIFNYEDIVTEIKAFIVNYDINLIVYCSVKRNFYDIFIQDDLFKTLKIKSIRHSDLSQFKSTYRPPESLGIDRCVSVYGQILSAKENFILFDLGTATTVDLVIGYEHQGGLIIPGIELSYQALIKQTDIKIKDTFKLGEELSFVGQTTSECISNGIALSHSLFIESTISAYQQLYPLSFEVILTGGNARNIAQYLNHQYQLKENTVIEGLVQIGSNIIKS